MLYAATYYNCCFLNTPCTKCLLLWIWNSKFVLSINAPYRAQSYKKKRFRGANSPTQQDPHNLWLTDWLIECSDLTLGLHHSCIYTLPVSASGHITKIKHWKLTRHKELPSIPNPSHLLVWGTFGSIRSMYLVVGWKIKHLSAHLGRKTERIYRCVQDMTLNTYLLCLESSSRFWVAYLFKKKN